MLTSIEMRKRYVIYVRAILSLTIVLVALYNYSVFEIPVVPAIIYMVLLVLSNFGFMFVPAGLYKGIKLHYLVFLLDLAFLVVGAFIFTQMNLTFLIAIFLTIFISSLSQSVGLSLVVALVVDAVYIYIMYITGGLNYSLMNDRALLNLPFMLIVALHSSYLAEKANEELSERGALEKINVLLTKKIISKSEQINAVTQFNDYFCDSFKNAVIILNDEGAVKMFNKSAERVFGLKQAAVLNTPVKDLEIPRQLKECIMNLQFKKQESDDVKMSIGEGAVKKIAATTTFIKNSRAEIIGILCSVREVAGE